MRFSRLFVGTVAMLVTACSAPEFPRLNLTPEVRAEARSSVAQLFLEACVANRGRPEPAAAVFRSRKMSVFRRFGPEETLGGGNDTVYATAAQDIYGSVATFARPKSGRRFYGCRVGSPFMTIEDADLVRSAVMDPAARRFGEPSGSPRIAEMVVPTALIVGYQGRSVQGAEINLVVPVQGN